MLNKLLSTAIIIKNSEKIQYVVIRAIYQKSFYLKSHIYAQIDTSTYTDSTKLTAIK